jgi:hypothetical protein
MISIAVEWENVLLTTAGRGASMLRQLGEELGAARRALGEDFELLVVHADESCDRTGIADQLGSESAIVRFVPAPGSGYYELKNIGIAHARGDVVVLVDSDVLPEPGWLVELLKPFADPNVHAVAGHSYVEPTSLWAKAFALGWFFPLRADAGGGIGVGESFFANNVAFRRETARAFPFPPVPGAARGACRVLAGQLRAHHVSVLVNPAALVSHPPPAGVRRAVARALVQGRDEALLAAAYPTESNARPFSVESVRAVGGRVREVVARRQLVGLSGRALPAALAIVLGYYALTAVGAASARIAPARAKQFVL